MKLEAQQLTVKTNLKIPTFQMYKVYTDVQW